MKLDAPIIIYAEVTKAQGGCFAKAQPPVG